jgi:hypothetical protein
LFSKTRLFGTASKTVSGNGAISSLYKLGFVIIAPENSSNEISAG